MRRMTTARAMLLLMLAASLAACTVPPRYRDVAHTVPALAPGEGRIYFYGDTLAWKGFRSDLQWHPTLLIDGQPIPTPSEREVVFYVDRAPGTYEISVDNDTRKRDRPPPETYPGQRLTVTVEPDRHHYVKLIRHGDDNVLNLLPQQHYLELKQVHRVLGEVEILRFGYPPSAG
jgi:hypothetical protein